MRLLDEFRALLDDFGREFPEAILSKYARPMLGILRGLPEVLREAQKAILAERREAERLRGKGLLDPGAGSTWAALEERGPIERRYDQIEVMSLAHGTRWATILWVKLTLQGRKMVRAGVYGL